MSSLVSLVKPLQIIRKHWRHLEDLQIGSMQWFIKDPLFKGRRCSKIRIYSQCSLRQIFEYSYIKQCGKGLFLFHFFLGSISLLSFSYALHEGTLANLYKPFALFIAHLFIAYSVLH